VSKPGRRKDDALHSELILNLVVAFVAAFAGGMLAARAGLPPLVGYLIAGVAIGPYTPGGSTDPAIAAQLAEVGVILLMFGVGLHFSVRELLEVGPVAIPGALGQSTVATLLGTGVAMTWGWSLTEGVILGLCLSVASTIVLLRALEDLNLLESHAGHVAVGWLIVEDLLTVVALVLLPAIATSGSERHGIIALLPETPPAVEVLLSLVQAGVFVALMLVVGVKVIPRLLLTVVRIGSSELFTLSILAIALGVAFGSAELFGASLALGAFLAGVVLNESELSHRAGIEALPLRDAFAVLFFVSVGMIFDPAILIKEPFEVAAVVAVIIVGKTVAAFAIVTLLGFGLRTGLTVSAALGQIGEFSFLLAALGVSLDLLPEEAYSIILAGALISISLNPFLFKQEERLERLFMAHKSFARFAGRREHEEDMALNVRRHLIIAGYGRSGASLARAMSGRNLPFVVIDRDPYVVERARAGGITCVLGDATQPLVLERARAAEARTLAITFNDQPDGPLTVQAARRLNPNIDITVRGGGPETHGLLRASGASAIIDSEFEASLEMVRHVLHRFGLDSREIGALQARWRAEYYLGGI
jgi:CPA2 family monovalent cation:H+ antiporter-2